MPFDPKVRRESLLADLNRLREQANQIATQLVRIEGALALLNEVDPPKPQPVPTANRATRRRAEKTPTTGTA